MATALQRQHLQARLLRVLQEREVDRIGGNKPVKVDIRILATSNRDLAEAVKHGTFREDLLYRLNVVNLRIPSLRERPKDIRALSHHFARKYAEVNGVPYRPLAPATERALAEGDWPEAGRDVTLQFGGGELGTISSAAVQAGSAGKLD